MMTDNYSDYLRILKQAQKDGERAITAYTGRTPSDTLADLTTGLPAGQIWVRINGEADPYNALYEDPSILQPNLAVKIIFDPEADSWVVKSINASVVIYDNGGATAPTFTVPAHDHTTDSTGGDLGANTVDTTQLVDDSVTQAKIDAGAVDTAQIADDAVTPTKTDGLSGASAEIVAQTASNTFTSIPYTLTSGTRLIYDGTEIRAVYYDEKINTGGFTTSGTTVSVIETSDDLASVANTTNFQLKMQSSFTITHSAIGSNFRYEWQYNYDNSGTEGWTTYATQQFSTFGTNYFNTSTYTCIFRGSDMTSPTWGYSGTYKVRMVVYRQLGSATITLNSGAFFQKSTTFEEMVN